MILSFLGEKPRVVPGTNILARDRKLRDETTYQSNEPPQISHFHNIPKSVCLLQSRISITNRSATRNCHEVIKTSSRTECCATMTTTHLSGLENTCSKVTASAFRRRIRSIKVLCLAALHPLMLIRTRRLNCVAKWIINLSYDNGVHTTGGSLVYATFCVSTQMQSVCSLSADN